MRKSLICIFFLASLISHEVDGRSCISGDSCNSPPHPFTLHPLGGRDVDDPLARMMVAHSPRGWHCPQCLHIATTKGNLKSHILSGRHKVAEKAYQCQFCHKSYSTKQSVGVHISTHHREERDRLYAREDSDLMQMMMGQQMQQRPAMDRWKPDPQESTPPPAPIPPPHWKQEDPNEPHRLDAKSMLGNCYNLDSPNVDDGSPRPLPPNHRQ